MLSPIKISVGILLAGRLFAGSLGYALHLDSAVVMIPDQSYLNFENGQAMTIEILFNVETTAPQNLMNKTEAVNTEWMSSVSVMKGWLVDLNSYYMREGDSFVLSTFVAAPSIVHAGISGSDFGIGQNHYVPGIENQWHHLTFQFTGQRLRTFVNGIQIQESDDIDLSSYDTQGVPLLIGGYNIQNLATSNGISTFLKGMVDELRIWNRMRTPAEIQRDMFGALSDSYFVSTDSGLVGYYRFDAIENLGAGEDNATDDIRDLSVYGNHADIAFPTQELNEYRKKGQQATLIPHEDISTKTDETSSGIAGFEISANYPNPFNAITHFQIQLSQAAQVELRIFDTIGRLIAVPVNQIESAGSHLLSWDAGEQPSGIYLYKIRIGERLESGKMIVEK